VYGGVVFAGPGQKFVQQTRDLGRIAAGLLCGGGDNSRDQDECRKDKLFHKASGRLQGNEKGLLQQRYQACFILFLPYFESRALRRHDRHEYTFQSLISWLISGPDFTKSD
jgi:hypothetical protein